MTKPTANLTEQTTRNLREMIASSGLKPGDVLAREAELGEELGVSRSILREAINRLRALGLLESRQCVGLVIGKPDPVALFEQAFESGLMDSLDMAELAELRYTLEIGAVELVVRRATPEQLARLEELGSEFAACESARSPKRSIDDIELDFHRTYLQASHSPMLMRMHYVITSFFRRAAREMPDWDAWSDEHTIWDHCAIAQALNERNVERSRAILAGHLSGLLSISESHTVPHSDKENDSSGCN